VGVASKATEAVSTDRRGMAKREPPSLFGAVGGGGSCVNKWSMASSTDPPARRNA
jgi:hypothetical protein